MKHFTLTILLCLGCISQVLSQAPQGFNYQAVIRDSNGEIIANDLVNVRFTIHQTTANGINIYQETHAPTTNEFGLVNVIIGQGIVNSGTFATINWSGDIHFLQVEVNPGGGFVDTGTQQLMSVPYALSALQALNSWSKTGNEGTDTTIHFIGTTDDESLRFRINNEDAGRIDRAFSNVFLGYHAGTTNIYGSYSGYSNVGLGAYALANNSTGVGNIGVGNYALFNGGYSNVAVGNSALYTNNGGFNCAFGPGSLSNNESGTYNTAIGYNSLSYDVAGENATVIGAFAMRYANSNSTPFTNRNIAVGYEALRGSLTLENNTGNANTVVGYQSMQVNTTGSSNSTLGDNALKNNTTGNSNTASGAYSLHNNTTADYNTAYGFYALVNTTIGESNTAIGVSALRTNVAGSLATAIGTNSMYNANNTSTAFTNRNVAVGYEALRGSSDPASNTGNNNTVIGFQSMLNNSSGDDNTAVGNKALNDNSAGSSNTAVGGGTLALTTTTSNNTALGFDAGGNQTTGSDCTFLGFSAEGSAGTYTNATAIGYTASVTASNRVRLGNTSVTQIGGQVAWSNLSDARLKMNVSPSTLGLDFIKRLQPVTYNFIEGHDGILYTGFLAQDVEKVLNELGEEFSGVTKPENETDYYAIRYAEFVMPLVNAVQEQQVYIEEQQVQMDGQQVLIEGQQGQMNEQQVLIERLQQMIAQQQKQIDLLISTQSHK
jgi:hypothetical protein